MVHFHHRCYTKKMIQKAKRRLLRKTQKVRKLLRHEPEKLLTVDELYSGSNLTCKPKNDILKHIQTLSANYTKQNKIQQNVIQELKTLKNFCISKLNAQHIKQNEIMLHRHNKKKSGSKEVMELNPEYYVYKQFGSQYNNYKICHFCKHYDILDVDALSKQFEYIDIIGFSFNPSNTYFSFCVDFVGNRNYHFFIKDIYEDRIIHVPLHRKNENLVCIHKTFSQYKRQISDHYLWIDDLHILYIGLNTYYNTSTCYTINVRTKRRRVVYQEQRHKQLSLQSVYSGFYHLLYACTYNSDEVFLLDVEDDKVHLMRKPILEAKPFVKYPYIDHIDATWYILKQDHGTFRFMKTMDFRNFETLFVKKDKYLDVQDVHFINQLFVFFFRIKGQCKIETYSMCAQKLQKMKCFDEEFCAMDTDSCHCKVLNVLPESNKLFISVSSFTKPNRLWMLEVDQQEHSLVPFSTPQKTANRYCEEVVQLKNNSIYITKIYKKGLNLKNVKCVLYGYGAYGDHYDADFNAKQVLTLCDKGYLVIISQISGDGTLGFQQRRNGMLKKKKNTFHDFIYIIEEYLFKRGITSRDKLAIWGRSAGGLLISAVLNLRPDICKAAILGVPFVSPYSAMLSEKTPLGYESHSEWGNPHNKHFKKYISSYSPLENICTSGDYPHMFIYSNLNDTLVPYIQPYKYYNTLMKDVDVYRNHTKDLYLHVEDRFGHNQGTSLKDRIHDHAIFFAFIEKYVS